jgi:hypothetical protein
MSKAADRFLASLRLDLPARILAATRVQCLFVNLLVSDPLYHPPELDTEWLEHPHHNWNTDPGARQHFHRLAALVADLGQHRIRTGLELAIIDGKDVVLVLTYDEWAQGVSLPGCAEIEYFQLTTTTPGVFESDVLVQQLAARAYTQTAGEEFALPLHLPPGFARYEVDPEVRLQRVPFTQPLDK